MLQLSNPRLHVEIPDWPCGRRTVTAEFIVEVNKRGMRVSRTTTGKPKSTTYHRRMAIVDGSDGRTYLLGETEFGQRVTLHGTMVGGDYYYPDSDPAMCEQIDRLLNEADLLHVAPEAESLHSD